MADQFLEDLDEILTTREVAVLLKVHEYRVAELCRRGLLPHFRMGRQLRFSASQIRQFIATGGRQLPGGWRRA